MAIEQWVRIYRLDRLHGIEMVHAQYVTHRFSRHAHEHFVIGIVEQGVQQYTYRGSKRTTPPGHVFFVNGGEPHTGEPATPNGYLYRTLCFDSNVFRELSLQIAERTPIPYLKGSVVADCELFSRLQRLHQAVAANAPSILCETLLLRVVHHLLEVHSEQASQTPILRKERALVRQVREYLEAHFTEDVSLSELGLLTLRSPFHLAHAFSKEVGLPPHAYQESLRIQRAKELLRAGTSVVETALAIGYPDQTHFTHRFRRHTGFTPGQYRTCSM